MGRTAHTPINFRWYLPKSRLPAVTVIARKCDKETVVAINLLGENALAILRARQLAFDLMDVKTTAKMMGVSVRTVRRWEAAGRMPERHKHGHRMKYRKQDIEAMVLDLRSEAQV